MKFVEVVPAYPNAYPIRYKEDYFYWPARMMMDRGFDVEFLTCQPGVDGQVHEGVKIRRFRNAFSALSHVNRDKTISLVHAHLRPYPPSFLMAFCNKPKILSPHTYFLGSNFIARRLSLAAMPKFDRIICFTPYERELYARAGIPEKKLVVLPHPIDHEFYSAKPRGMAAIRKRLGLKADEFVVVTVANLRRFKRIETLLQAFSLLGKSAKARLVIVGDDLLWREGAPSLEQLIREFNVKNVIRTGALDPDGVREALSVSDVFVNTSDNEAQGLAAYEAAAAGLPLCLSGVGSFTSVFGELALYHHYTDFEKLAANLRHYYDDRKSAATAGRKLQSFVRQWDFNEIRKRMSSLYEEVMSSWA